MKQRKSRWAQAAAGLLLLLLIAALPAYAAGEGAITPEMTVRQLRENQSLQDSGYFLYSRGDDLSCIVKMTWEDRTFEEYVGTATAPDAARALNLVIENHEAGVQVTHQVYTPEEIAAEPVLGRVQLFYFPAKTSGAKYALVVPGNAMLDTGEMSEGASLAWQLHEQGYAVFVLRYRTFLKAADNAPLNDLCRAMQYITQHAEEFGVQPENYALVGCSSGGQLAGLYANAEIGYGRLGLPRPAALLLAYPVNDFLEFKPVYHLLMDMDRQEWRYYWTNISDNVTEGYPPVYHWFGKNDETLALMGLWNQGPALEKALCKYNVPHKYVVYENAPHAIGSGCGTDAEGWVADAVAFWEEQVSG